jgi:hypothetical protein
MPEIWNLTEIGPIISEKNRNDLQIMHSCYELRINKE